jgi:flagellar basal body-associated protein FliL
LPVFQHRYLGQAALRARPDKEKVKAMSGSILAIILIPIVVAACLVALVAMVFHADRHPHRLGRGDAPDREVTGGIFRGDPGQVSPRRDAPPREAADLTDDTPADRR